MAGVGYGDIVPTTSTERVFCMFVMIITAGFSAYLIGVLKTVFNRSSLMSQEIKLKSLHINQFLMYNNIPNELRMQILNYLDFLVEYRKVNKLDESQVFSMLNETLKEQVIAYLNGKIIKEWQCFDQFDIMFLSEVTFILQNHLFSIDDKVFEENESGNQMFFIAKGSIILAHL